ncbi:hypothetical protein BJY04DRAFT_219846 [Aspergillus karnatakaensis]|uniref:uncharacterized protein n=1 Tax=Aspergillus karnatakaensis TaxID=1810916 RepID=UPI003CCCB4F8
MIPQDYSWGRLCITEPAFQRLTDYIKPFPSFFDLTAAFGFKTSSDQRAFHGWRACTSGAECLGEKHEFCYNIQHVERHGRKLKDPWSLRQTGVYHQYCDTGNQSRWVLLNPNERLRNLVTSHSQTTPEGPTPYGSSLSSWGLDIQLLVSLGLGWPDYIEYLQSELSRLNDAVCYSSVDSFKPQPYTLAYADLQELHILQPKFQTAETALSSCLSIAKGLRTHLDVQGGPNLSRVLQSLDAYEVDIARHLTQLHTLDTGLKRTIDLSTKLLMFQNEELQRGSNKASSRTLTGLFELASQSRQHQETLNGFMWHGRVDSAMLKALSVVATIFIPATLVATIFSSNLVQAAKSETPESNYNLALSPQFWVYIAISLPLTVVVLVVILYIGYKTRQAISPRLQDNV